MRYLLLAFLLISCAPPMPRVGQKFHNQKTGAVVTVRDVGIGLDLMRRNGGPKVRGTPYDTTWRPTAEDFAFLPEPCVVLDSSGWKEITSVKQFLKEFDPAM